MGDDLVQHGYCHSGQLHTIGDEGPDMVDVVSKHVAAVLLADGAFLHAVAHAYVVALVPIPEVLAVLVEGH